MRKDFVNEVAMHNKIERADLVEKDLILHQILTDLSKNEFFSITCLQGGKLDKMLSWVLSFFRRYRLRLDR